MELCTRCGIIIGDDELLIDVDPFEFPAVGDRDLWEVRAPDLALALDGSDTRTPARRARS